MLPSVHVLRQALDFIRPRDKVHLFSGPSADLKKLSHLFGLTKRDVPDAVLIYHLFIHPVNGNIIKYYPFKTSWWTRKGLLDPLPGNDDDREDWFNEATRCFHSDHPIIFNPDTSDMWPMTPDSVSYAISALAESSHGKSRLIIERFSRLDGFARTLSLVVMKFIMFDISAMICGKEPYHVMNKIFSKKVMKIALEYGFDPGYGDGVIFQIILDFCPPRKLLGFTRQFLGVSQFTRCLSIDRALYNRFHHIVTTAGHDVEKKTRCVIF